MNNILKEIEKRTGIKDFVESINKKLSGSQLNSFLLELFRKRTSQITPASVLAEFYENRFCLPSTLDPVILKEEEIKWLNIAKEFGFKPIQLSPLTPLGTCSSVALVHQNNIVTALRGTEIISDATNVLALKTAQDIKEINEYNKYCTTHRHVRGQYFTNPYFSAHFAVFCMVTPGIDEGSYNFEIKELENHLEFYRSVLATKYNTRDIMLKLFIADQNTLFTSKLEYCLDKIRESKIDIIKENKRNDYYDIIQFKYYIRHKDEYLDIADGGFVSWTQKFLSNRKQRLLISGAGLELMSKIDSGII